MRSIELFDTSQRTLVGKSCWWSSNVASIGHVRLRIIESDQHEKSCGNKFLSSHSTSVRDRMCVILADDTAAKKKTKNNENCNDDDCVLAMRLCRTNIKIVMSTLLGSVKERRKERQLTSIYKLQPQVFALAFLGYLIFDKKKRFSVSSLIVGSAWCCCCCSFSLTSFQILRVECSDTLASIWVYARQRRSCLHVE